MLAPSRALTIVERRRINYNVPEKRIPAPFTLRIDKYLAGCVEEEKASEVEALLESRNVIVFYSSPSGSLRCGLIDKSADLSSFKSVVDVLSRDEVACECLRLDVRPFCKSVLHLRSADICYGRVLSVADPRAEGATLNRVFRDLVNGRLGNDLFPIFNTWTSDEMHLFSETFFTRNHSVVPPTLFPNSSPDAIATREEIIRMREMEMLGASDIAHLLRVNLLRVHSVLRFHCAELYFVQDVYAEEVSDRCGFAVSTMQRTLLGRCKEEFDFVYTKHHKDLDRTKGELCISDTLADILLRRPARASKMKATEQNAVVAEASESDDDVFDNDTPPLTLSPVDTPDDEDARAFLDFIVGIAVRRRKAQLQAKHAKEMENLRRQLQHLTESHDATAKKIEELLRAIETTRFESGEIERQRHDVENAIREREAVFASETEAETRRLLDKAPYARLDTRLLVDDSVDRLLNFADAESSRKRSRCDA